MESTVRSQSIDGDRISSLPNHVAHHIFSFLTMQELAPLCLTSKKLRELCISIPFLTIDGIQYKNNSSKQVRFIDYIDRFIALRQGMETKKISIRWPFETAKSGEEFRVLTWLHTAIGCKVELLDLEFDISKEDVFILPLGVFNCASLMELKVNLHGGNLKLPSPNGFSVLQSLSLKRVKILYETFGGWILSFYKHLKKLYLDRISGTENINIKSSTLQELRITNINVSSIRISAEMLQSMTLHWFFDSSSGKSLEVFAPNLSNFDWQGSRLNSLCLGNMEHIRTLVIVFRPPSLSEKNGFCTNQSLSELLGRACSVSLSTLYLDGDSIKVLYKQGCLSTLVLHAVLRLEIFTSNLNDDFIPAIACLLKGTSNLRRLSIRYREYLGKRSASALQDGFTRGYWESQGLLIVDKLKVASIDLFHMGYNDLELIKYLLKHAKSLDKMTIFYSPPFPSDVSRMINNYKKSSAAEVAFCPKP